MTFIYTPPEPDTHCFDTDENKDVWSYSKDLHMAEVERVRRETVEACAKVCDDYSDDKWRLYKGRSPYNGTEQGRADPDTQGHSDGASNCADKIRELLK